MENDEKIRKIIEAEMVDGEVQEVTEVSRSQRYDAPGILFFEYLRDAFFGVIFWISDLFSGKRR